MKLKAKYIGKYTDTSYGQFVIHLEYEYRGMRYTVHEDRRNGNELLSWQHRSNQDWIDRILDLEQKQKQTKQEPIDWNEIWAMMEWD